MEPWRSSPFGALGIVIALDEALWAGAIVAFATLAVGGLGLGLLRHGRPWRFLIGVLGAMGIGYTVYVQYARSIELSGFVLLSGRLLGLAASSRPCGKGTDAHMSYKAWAQFDPSLYGRWRQSRLGHIHRHARTPSCSLLGPVTERRVLDVGCGDGDLGLALAQSGAQVTGIDADPRMLEATRRRFEAAGAEMRLARADTEVLPFGNGSFDVVTAVTVLCFVRQPERAISEMARVLKPGGRMVVGELGRYSSWAAWRRLRAWFGNAVWSAGRFRSASELRALATEAGLAVQSVRAAAFYPPVGWIAAVAAPLDRWLGCRIVNGGAFLVLAANKPFDEQLETDSDER